MRGLQRSRVGAHPVAARGVRGERQLPVRHRRAAAVARVAHEAVEKGLAKPHGPIPKTNTTPRRRMDRRAERRLGKLKTWRGAHAKDLSLDPGVLCPNAALETIACANPKHAAELKELTGLKSWFVESFGADVVAALANEGDPEPESDPKTASGSSKPGGRGRSKTRR